MFFFAILYLFYIKIIIITIFQKSNKRDIIINIFNNNNFKIIIFIIIYIVKLSNLIFNSEYNVYI